MNKKQLRDSGGNSQQQHRVAIDAECHDGGGGKEVDEMDANLLAMRSEKKLSYCRSRPPTRGRRRRR